ncbi:MAG: hypothetical protein WDM76_06130 [Limisphaerales bacterium]
MNKMTGTTWVNVAMFEELNDGQVLEQFIKSKRIEARIHNDRMLQLFLFLCPPRATFRVQVRYNDFKRTIDILDSGAGVSAVLQKAIRCPSCGSLRVEYPQMTRKFFLPTLLLHLGIIFRVIEHECYCENCHHIWNLPKTPSVPHRVPC